MLVSLKEILPKAKRKGYAVGAFNISNIEGAQAVLAAALALKSPVVLQTSEKAMDYAGFEPLKSALLALINAVNIPVVLHLDHGRSFEIAKKCIDAGWSSVMIDVSKKPFRENVFDTKKTVDYAKKRNVSVEGELGVIPGQEDYVKNRSAFMTDPEFARMFVGQTGVDAFAGSVGLAHGVEIKKEKLDLKRLAEIAAMIPDVPMVLHGASEGVTDAEIKKAIKIGITKINIDTELRLQWNKAIRAFLAQNKNIYDPRTILKSGTDAMREVVIKKISLFGSVKQA